MVRRAQNQSEAVPPKRQPPSYGALFQDAAQAVATARVHEVGPFHDPRHAANVVVDYERYLAIAGRHLQLLVCAAVDTSQLVNTSHRALVARMAGLRMDRRGGNAWAAAGDRLGIAHDLLATHIGPGGELRTPDARLLTRPDVQVAATARTLELVREPLALSRDILTAARRVQPRAKPPLPRSTHLGQAIASIQRALDSAPLSGLPTDELAQLDRLTPATTQVGSDSGPDLIGSEISALQLLRQLSYRQSLGIEHANAHTLQDLCALAAATCRSASALLPLPDTPLGRVQRAASLDEMHRAALLWEKLGRSLNRFQGLSKAPAIYRDAIRVVAGGSKHTERVTRAVLASLPRLAIQAAVTVETLYDNHELVTPRRAPGHLTARWHPIDAATCLELASGFAEAAQATRHARTAALAPSENGHVAKCPSPVDASSQRRTHGVLR